MREIVFLIEKEIQSEFRQKYAFNGLLLYVVSTVFVCYLSFRQIVDLPTWNALFWIIQLFAGVNAISKSFLQEGRGRMLYYYTLTNPRSFILAKILYNLLLMMILSAFNLIFYSLFIGNPVQDLPMFLIAMFLGSAGFSAVLSMVSAIASKSGNNFALMSILSFPILIPLLMVTIRFSKNAMDGLPWMVSQHFIILLLALISMVFGLSYLLFPYLWRD